MGVGIACLWALLGAALMESTQLLMATGVACGFPWKHDGRPATGPYAAALGFRLGTAVGLVALLAAVHHVQTPVFASGLGAFAPIALIRLARLGPVPVPAVPGLPPRGERRPGEGGTAADARRGGTVDAR
ncbi:hypothetical protein [Streptomyces sp. NPDC053048]|uniref:hypothetical protein n=1 Tax=Streptomyces sp. NPDC053048 TaxID=3365694 RepID=UPI0037D76BB5